MEQFDFKFYYNFYPDLHKYNINTPEKLLEHYKIYGKNENRVKNKLELLRRCKFNPDIYRYNYEDLHSLSKTELENHFINHGMNEERVVDKYLIKTIEGKSFDVEAYYNNHPDLRNLNNLQLLNHYKKIGRTEQRICDYKVYDLSKINILIDNKFNPDIYRNNNSDLEDFNSIELQKHYIEYGIDEKRVVNYIIPKICIIYVYYERKNEQKNQTNLAFFIKYGLDKNRWKNMDITTLIIINGKQCEVMIPEREDIIIIKQNNCSDWEGWYDGIKYMEEKHNKPIYKLFNHLCLINCGSSGPIYEEGIDRHWLDPFLEKMKKENSVICSPCCNILSNIDAGGPGIRVVPHFVLIKINENIINLLLNTFISPTCPNSLENKYLNMEKNTIIGRKNNKGDSILTGEYGLSRILIQNGYRISCLMIDNIYLKDNNIELIIDKIYDNCKKNPSIIMKQIFVKNNWRVNKKLRVSIPYYYEEVNEFILKKNNCHNIFDDIKINYNYDLINIEEKGTLADIYNKKKSLKYNWNSKKEFYNLYGYSEEFVIWPTNKNNNTSVVIYCHYDKDDIIKDYVINSLKTLMILEYDIIFCSTSNKIKNVDLPFKINYYKNQGIGSDWIIWLTEMKKILNYSKKYDNIILINDSLLFPIHGIDNMKTTIQNLRYKNDFWGLWESDEIELHIVGTPIEFKFNLLKIIVEFIEKAILLINKPDDYINFIEIKLVKHLRNKGFVCNALELFSVSKYNYCPCFNPLSVNKWILDKRYFAVKWKYVGNYLKYKELNNKYLNYLFRYLKVGNKIPNIYNYFKFNKKILVIACHTNNYIKLKAIKSIINFLYEYVEKILIINSIEYKNTIEIFLNDVNNKFLEKIDIYYTKNDSFNCFSKIVYLYDNFDFSKYDNIIYTNDSHFIINSLESFINIIEDKYELIGLHDSYQGNYHYPDYLRCYNNIGFKKIINYYKDNMKQILNRVDLVSIFEISSMNIFNNYKIKCLYKVPQDFNTFLQADNNLFEKFLKKGFPSIKIKKIYSNTIYNKDEQFSDFNPKIYKNLHNDLVHLSDKCAHNHFINYGIIEGRIYKEKQKINCNKYLKKIIDKINL